MLTSVAGVAASAKVVLAGVVDVESGVDAAEGALAFCSTVARLACSTAGALSFFSIGAGVVGSDCADSSSGSIATSEGSEVALSEGKSVLGVDSGDDEPVVVVPVVEVFAPPEAETVASGSESSREDVDVDPEEVDESEFAGAFDASAGDEVESVVSAFASAGLCVTAKPIPSATTSTPIRPM